MWNLSFKKTVSFTKASIVIWEEGEKQPQFLEVELPIKARNEKDFAKWYKRTCEFKNPTILSVSDMYYFKRKYKISFNDLMRYGKEVA